MRSLVELPLIMLTYLLKTYPEKVRGSVMHYDLETVKGCLSLFIKEWTAD
jgi:hypothetical protein